MAKPGCRTCACKDMPRSEIRHSPGAQRPFAVTVFDLPCDTLDASQLDNVFWRNACEFYGMRDQL